MPSRNGIAGVLSIGGTSTELTSTVEERNQITKEGVRLQLYGQTHTVYTHHCPCHGTEQLRSRLLSMLMQVSICLKGSWKGPGYYVSPLHQMTVA